MTRRAVIYARISVASEESVSITRQIESGRKYAEARGWDVVATFADEGVSATRLKPRDRPSWKRMLASSESFEVVIAWKIDRLARRLTDFLEAHESLMACGAAIVCVEQSIDMTSGEGRAFAQMLAVFSELEASSISSRVKAGRAQVLATGRSPGGLQPYGWRTIANPAGPGRVRAKDPDRIECVREMAARALRGESVSSILSWLSKSGAPPPKWRTPGQQWHFSMVDQLLQNPVLAGLTPCNPGSRSGARGPEVVRDASGAPVVSADIAIISVAEHLQLVNELNHKKHPSARGKPRRPTSPLLAKLVLCGSCRVVMYRHHDKKGPSLRCRSCRQMISYRLLREHVERRLFEVRGHRAMHRRVTVVEGDPDTSRRLARLDHALQAAAVAMTADVADITALNKEVIRLRRARDELRLSAATRPTQILEDTGSSLREVWQSCESDEQRREILDAQISSLTVTRGRGGGHGLDTSRVSIAWRRNAEGLMPRGTRREPPRTSRFDELS
jgi:site-specific DNA recombinase